VEVNYSKALVTDLLPKSMTQPTVEPPGATMDPPGATIESQGTSESSTASIF